MGYDRVNHHSGTCYKHNSSEYMVVSNLPARSNHHMLLIGNYVGDTFVRVMLFHCNVQVNKHLVFTHN